MTTDWTEFEGRLARALPSVADRVFLIVSCADSPGHYVQFAADGNRLDAETPGARFGARADEGALLAAGWQSPDPIHNLTSPLPLPALTSEYRQLAGRCVVALRDVYGLVSPAELVYTAWRDGEVLPSGITVSQERIDALDRGDMGLEIPELGLSREDPPVAGRG